VKVYIHLTSVIIPAKKNIKYPWKCAGNEGSKRL
jgi:hypothetical protein